MQCATMEKESGDIEYAYTYREAHIIVVCEFSYIFLDCKAFQTTARCASLFLRMFFDWVERKRLCSPPEPLHLVLDSSSLSLMA